MEHAAHRPPLVVGLTGGIGSGKSAAAETFSSLGVPVIDADALAREVVRPGTAGLAEVVRTFGRQVLDASGALDRRKMRETVLQSPERRRQLEALLHPRIRVEMERRLAAVREPYCVLTIPLLVEADQTGLVDRVLVIDVPRELQIRRTQARDGSSRETVEGILHAQADRDQRLAAADDVIDNQGSVADLRRRVEQLHRRYLRIARARICQAPASGRKS